MLTVTKETFDIAHKICKSNVKLVTNCNPIALAIYKKHTILDRGISVEMDLERTKIKTLYTSMEYKKRDLPVSDLQVVNSKQVHDFLVDFYALLYKVITKDEFEAKWALPLEVNFKDGKNDSSSQDSNNGNIHKRWFSPIYYWVNQCKEFGTALINIFKRK